MSKKQKIRADGTSGYNKKTNFDEDGNEVEGGVELVEGKDIDVGVEEREYVERVKRKLEGGKEEDKKREKERIREKRLKIKGDREEVEEREEDSGGSSESGSESEGSGSGSESDDSGSDDSGSDNDDSGSDSEDDEERDIQAKKAEEMLLKGL